MPAVDTQRDRALRLFGEHDMLRLRELAEAGITAATVARMVRSGEVFRISRGLYQLADAELDLYLEYAEAAKRVPRGVICLLSALVWHELTDQFAQTIWMAVGVNAWTPRLDHPPLSIVRFTDRFLTDGVEDAMVGKVPVKVFGAAKTVADCYRHRRSVPRIVALEGLQKALRYRKATPAEIADHARRGGVWKAMRPHLEALTANA